VVESTKFSGCILANLPAHESFVHGRRGSFRTKLLAWYREHARDLPWRKTHDAYRVWISEVMLQQTQVATVVPYFDRFLIAFPSIADLAAAPEDQVLRLWEGLGYYRRARQLHRAARLIAEVHNGEFPRNPDDVRRLPGIGRYTAGAILSIAFGAAEPILEANTVRLLARLLALRDDPTSGPSQKILWRAAADLLPRENIGAFNQALMELGSQVCVPREPRCPACPVAALCPTRKLGLQKVIPATPPKPPIEDVKEAAIVVHRRGRLLLRRRQATERWAGMWDFPRFAIGQPSLAAEGNMALSQQVRELTGLSIGPVEHLTTIRHGVTRFRITLDCYLATAAGRCSAPDGAEIAWTSPGELDEYAMSVTGRKLGGIVATRGLGKKVKG